MPDGAHDRLRLIYQLLSLAIVGEQTGERGELRIAKAPALQLRVGRDPSPSRVSSAALRLDNRGAAADAAAASGQQLLVCLLPARETTNLALPSVQQPLRCAQGPPPA